MERAELSLDTAGAELVDLTDDCRRFCAPLGDGLLSVFVPHATAGIAVIELGAGTEPDLIELLDRILPRDDRYTHRHGSKGHGGDHVLPAVIGPSLVVPVDSGRLALGTWQHIVFVDRNRDNPRRTVRLSFLAG